MMESFVKKQGLPESKAAFCAVSSEGETAQFLKRAGVRVIELPLYKNIQRPVASHADMLLCHIKDNRVFVAAGLKEVADTLKEEGFNVVQSRKPLSEKYPGDISLNALYIGGRLYCKGGFADKGLIEYCESEKIEIVNVRQGYARCSVCVVDENSVITADSSLAKTLGKNGVEVLKIQSGYIDLPGYDYGFIGGCSAKLSKNLILFCGSLNFHPDGERIRNFIESRGIKIIETNLGPLRDIGGVAVLKEGE